MTDSWRILVADDEEIIREACERIMRRAGHQVLVAADGRQALEYLKNECFDLLLLDIKMPGIDGLEIMNIIKRERCGVKVVVITGHGTNDTAARAALAGASGFLTKPFSPNQLRQEVKRAMRRRSDVRETAVRP